MGRLATCIMISIRRTLLACVLYLHTSVYMSNYVLAATELLALGRFILHAGITHILRASLRINLDGFELPRTRSPRRL